MTASTDDMRELVARYARALDSADAAALAAPHTEDAD